MSTEHPDARWFARAKFGAFLLLCPSAVRGLEMSNCMLRSFRPPNISQEDYNLLADELKAERYDPEELVRMVKSAGVSYVILTAKHHDGYCLWDTTTTDFSAPKTGPGRDLVRPFVEAVREAGLKVGLYWSVFDHSDPDAFCLPGKTSAFHNSPQAYRGYDPERWERFRRRSVEQIHELLSRYGRIDLFWFDGPDYPPDRWHAEEIINSMRNLQPHIVVNDRLPGYEGDFTTLENQIPTRPTIAVRSIFDPRKWNRWWETCIPIQEGQWGFRGDDSTLYKSARQVIRYLSEVAGKGGNLCVGLPLKPDGTFPAGTRKRLESIAGWMSHSAESVIGVEGGPDPGCFYGPVTRRNSTLYLHVLGAPRGEIELRIDGTMKGAWLVRERKALNFHRATVKSRYLIELCEEQCDPLDTVVAAEFESGFIAPGL